MAEALPKDVRAARAFLYKRGIQAHKVSPRKFANAAQELDVTFDELLKLIGLTLQQGQGQAAQRQQYLDTAALKTLEEGGNV